VDMISSCTDEIAVFRAFANVVKIYYNIINWLLHGQIIFKNKI